MHALQCKHGAAFEFKLYALQHALHVIRELCEGIALAGLLQFGIYLAHPFDTTCRFMSFAL